MDLSHVLLQSFPEPHVVISRDMVCVAVNEPFAELLHVRASDLVGRSVSGFWPDAARVCSISGEHTIELLAAGQKAITARVSCFVSDVVVVRVLASVAAGDSAQIHHKQRIETLGILAGGIAHDFNNVLTGILGHVAYMKHVLPEAGAAAESIKAIEEGALRASGLTQQILKFSKLDSSDHSVQVDVADLVGRIGTLLKSAIPAEVTLKMSPSTRGFHVLASEAHITQILINLIINARDAISGRGVIDVSLESSCEAEEVRSLFGDEPASSVYGAIVVRDDGIGMNDDVKARLFEPYFTTKSSAGTGLGLATVNSIVKQLGGAIEVISAPGAGTTFRVVLPAVAEESAVLAGQHQESDGLRRGHGERVLVIDDEYAVRNVLGLSLAHLGYEVETAAGGAEGVEKFESDPQSFGLVILDLLMPGLSGEEVFHRLRAIRPELRVLIVSGFSSEHVVQRILEDGAQDFIQKPFSIEVLSEKVRGCLRD
jgi:two-component system cell cycle sensor histidine kinase/response regulator CckA